MKRGRSYPSTAALLVAVTIVAACGRARPIEVSDMEVGRVLDGGLSRVHPAGILDKNAADFHGRLIVEVNYDFALCAGCHGSDFSGGASRVSCLNCHAGGPTGCAVCHGEPPQTGAHAAHARGPSGALVSRPLACTECHLTPTLYTDVGHLFREDGSVISPPATVTFGAFSKTSYAGAPRSGQPTWTAATGTCANVYCHGGAFSDGNARDTAPSWTGGSAETACGTCHGLPPSSHEPHWAASCAACHSRIATNNPGEAPVILDPARHIDGVVTLGDGSGTCTACHGGPAGPAPPRDLAGHSDPAAISVGAHTAHLFATHQLGGRVACVDCHLVPARVDSPGHLDNPGASPVFPAATSAQSLAFAGGAQPAWDRVSGACANVYCHGGGTKAASDKAVTLKRAPLWTGGTAQAECGSCHGVPPVDAAHAGVARGLEHCVDCHARTIDARGAIVVTGAPGHEVSAHINGVIDVTP